MDRRPRLFDRAALARNRARARRAGAPPFLQEEAAAEIRERLRLVNRTFERPVVVTGWPDAWEGVAPGARIVPDDEFLDLGEGGHDLAVHAMALHWADDPVGQLVQCRRALAPDGLFLGALPGGRTLRELRAALAGAEAALCGGLSPRVAPMAEIRDLGALLQRAGFALPVADSLDVSATYADAFALMRDLRAMGEGNALSGRRRGFTRRAVLLDAARRYAEAFPSGGGRVGATFEIIHLAGWAPAEGQPRPLRPGSAAARLADALGAAEIPLRGGDRTARRGGGLFPARKATI